MTRHSPAMTDLAPITYAPAHELSRSPAAAAIGDAAARSGMILAHFERRLHLPTPDEWMPEGRPDLQGQRADEHKYQHHHNENPVGSFNPTHRAKWTTHELCHGLVGFAWTPNATPLFRLLAARLSEVVPVALWYFFDEAQLARCAAHDGPLFTMRCPACEAAAGHPTAPSKTAAQWRADGLAFVQRELGAVRRSIETGLPVSHRFATLDLHSDALAYTAAHTGRLTSPTFARFIELFHADDALGRHASLEALMIRIEAVAQALAENRPITPLRSDRPRMVAQDVGWRLLMVAADCAGETADLLDALAVRLAEDPEALDAVIAEYTDAAQTWWLPPPADVFGVGYPLSGAHGLHRSATEASLSRICPNSLAVLDTRAEPLIEAFIQSESGRGQLALRFADWLAKRESSAEADLTRYEALCAHPGPADTLVDVLGDGGAGDEGADVELARCDHLNLLRMSIDADALIRALESDDDVPDGIERPVCMVIRRRSGGDVLVAEISALAADALDRLRDGPLAAAVLDLPRVERMSLLSLGVIRPARWSIG